MSTIATPIRGPERHVPGSIFCRCCNTYRQTAPSDGACLMCGQLPDLIPGVDACYVCGGERTIDVIVADLEVAERCPGCHGAGTVPSGGAS